MRELIAPEFVALDGVVEAPGSEPGHRHSGRVAETSRTSVLRLGSSRTFLAGVVASTNESAERQ